MNPRTSLTTASGRMIDLLDPKPGDIVFMDLAEHLSKENRYNGATPARCYSVAEHSVRCADAAQAATGDVALTRLLLLHDCHEAYLKDDTTPKKRALGVIAEQSFGVLAREIEQAFRMLTCRLDVAIHTAAGVTFPPSAEQQEAIHLWDRRLLATEWRDLMGCAPPFDFGAAPLDARIEPMDWRDARNLFFARCRAWLPAFEKVA